jgi:hypothetical protein
MLRDPVINARSAFLLAVMGGLSVRFALLIERLGPLRVVIVLALLVFVFVLPPSLGRAITRFRDLRKRLTWWLELADAVHLGSVFIPANKLTASGIDSEDQCIGDFAVTA